MGAHMWHGRGAMRAWHMSGYISRAALCVAGTLCARQVPHPPKPALSTAATPSAVGALAGLGHRGVVKGLVHSTHTHTHTHPAASALSAGQVCPTLQVGRTSGISLGCRIIRLGSVARGAAQLHAAHIDAPSLRKTPPSPPPRRARMLGGRHVTTCYGVMLWCYVL